MTETKTIEHEYGTETIELAECDSCRQLAKEQKMREFRIYNNECEDYISGSICPSCRELDSPIEYPSVDRITQDDLDCDDVVAALSFISPITAVFFLLLHVLIGLIVLIGGVM